MTQISKIFLFLAVIMIISFSCRKKEEFPVIPHIEFISFTKLQNTQGIDTAGILKFSFTDGDGDIGLYKKDSLPPYDFNLFISYFEKKDGVFEEAFQILYNNLTQTFDTLPFHGRIPILTPDGNDKNIKGEIEDILQLSPISDATEIKYKVYIKDRALNKSNVIETPEIPIITK